MVSYRVVFAPEAEAQTVSLYRYIRQEASAEIAERFTASIIEHCEGLGTYPNRGTPRDDIRRGLRTIAFRRRVTIAYTVDGDRFRFSAFIMAGKISPPVGRTPISRNNDDATSIANSKAPPLQRRGYAFVYFGIIVLAGIRSS